MLNGAVGKEFGNVVLAYELGAVAGVRTDDIRRKFGRELVVHVVVRLIFGEHFGIFELAHVVIVCRGAGKFAVFAYGVGARLSELSDHDRVVVRARRLLPELFDELGVLARQFAQAEYGEFGEHYLEHGQHYHVADDAEETAERAVGEDYEIGADIFDEEQLHYAYYEFGGDYEHYYHEDGLDARLYGGGDEYSRHARAECDEQADAAYPHGVVRRKADGEIDVDYEQYERIDDVEEYRLAPAQKGGCHEREYGERTRVGVDELTYQKGYEQR